MAVDDISIEKACETNDKSLSNTSEGKSKAFLSWLISAFSKIVRHGILAAAVTS